MTVTTQVRLPDDLAEWARHHASDSGLSMNQVIVAALERSQMVEAAADYNEIAKHRDQEAELAHWYAQEEQLRNEERR